MSSRGSTGKNDFEWKTDQKLKLRGLKVRGLRQNEISTPYIIYENDRRNKFNTTGDFSNKTTTHSDAAHAISKSNSQGIGQNFLIEKKRQRKKIMPNS